MPELLSITRHKPEHESLLVWDAEEIPEAASGLTVLWRHTVACDAANQLSVVRMVEERADTIRSRYLAWVHDFGEAKINGRRVIDHLALRPTLSFWWMTSLAQQFNLGSHSGIDDTLKALALEDLMEHPVQNVRLHSSNAGLAECLGEVCRRRGISFVWSRPVQATRRPFFDCLPATSRAVVYLIWYWLKALTMLVRRPALSIKGDVMFIDVLVHLDRRALAEGRFGSSYWTDLVPRLKEWKVSCLWGHLFFRHPDTRTPSIAARMLQLFNRNSPPDQSHFLWESHLRPVHLLSALRDYWRISCIARRLRTLKRPVVPDSSIDPWPLHRYEWEDSLRGREAILNCLRVSLFETVMASLPRQRIGIYLCENQPWELALLYAWRISGHRELVGVPHTTVRFWDLRYHRDPRCYKPDPSGLGLPLPDRIAVNGALARESLLTGGCPHERLFEVEALRFTHLQAQPISHQIRSTGASLRVLVCGDFLADNNARLFSWLEAAADELPINTQYLIKPHPAFPVEPQHYPSLSFQIREDPIASLLQECDVVFAGSTTSAAVDAFCAGVPVVQMRDGRKFDTSPLRGWSGIAYVESPKHLADALRQAKASEVSPSELFNFDPGLARWGSLLGVEGLSPL